MRPSIKGTLLWTGLFLASATGCAIGNGEDHSASNSPALCSDAWYDAVEAKVPNGDGHGHGPDTGSVEWKSVVEFRLGIRGQPDVPARDSDAWCQHIDQIMSERSTRT